jgi:hypothetical protein
MRLFSADMQAINKIASNLWKTIVKIVHKESSELISGVIYTLIPKAELVSPYVLRHHLE